MNDLGEVFFVALKLGLTSFGGPIAHFGYFHAEYVERRKWIDNDSFSELVAICQFLPGPASSQLGIGIGAIRAGLLGGIVAWLGFTLPSAIALLLFAFYMKAADFSAAPWIHGLQIVAVAIVCQAVVLMGRKLLVNGFLLPMALAAMAGSLLFNSIFSQLAIVMIAGFLGLVIFDPKALLAVKNIRIGHGKGLATGCLIVFLLLLFLLPGIRMLSDNYFIAIADGFYRSGSLVFGGGHVVLPLLEKEVVANGMISKDVFVAGYGAAQAVPGPLFTFAAFLGASSGGIFGAILAIIAIFLPAYLLVIGFLPFWQRLRQNKKIGGALIGVNAAVVGLLLAALYSPMWTSAIKRPVDLFLFMVLIFILMVWRLPPVLVVLLGIIGSIALAHLGWF